MVTVFPTHSLIAQESLVCEVLTRTSTRGGRKGEKNVYISMLPTHMFVVLCIIKSESNAYVIV